MMDYFELFEIPVQLKVNAALLSVKYHELSRKFHPDYFIGEPEDAQLEVLEKSALLNKAYKTFKDPDETIRYVLTLKNLMGEEEKYELPPGFLMEVMDINEQLMDSDDFAARKGMETAILQLQQSIYEPVKKIVEGYQEGITTEEELLQVKEYYYKKKYLDRIERQLKETGSN